MWMWKHAIGSYLSVFAVSEGKANKKKQERGRAATTRARLMDEERTPIDASQSGRPHGEKCDTITREM
jgi:hypothetical protein